MAKMHLELRVNEKEVEALAEPRMLLIHLLREQLGITGPHIGCDTSHCGACTVDMNGKSVKSCTVFAVQAQGADIITVEGLVGGDGSLHPLQEAFREHHGLQCGFCTPGMITRAYRLLQEILTRARPKFATALPVICAVAPAILPLSGQSAPPRSV